MFALPAFFPQSVGDRSYKKFFMEDSRILRREAPRCQQAKCRQYWGVFIIIFAPSFFL